MFTNMCMCILNMCMCIFKGKPQQTALFCCDSGARGSLHCFYLRSHYWSSYCEVHCYARTVDVHLRSLVAWWGEGGHTEVEASSQFGCEVCCTDETVVIPFCDVRPSLVSRRLLMPSVLSCVMLRRLLAPSSRCCYCKGETPDT